MKYLLLLFSICIIFNVYALEENNNIKTDVEIINCVSANDIWVKYENITERLKLLAYDRTSGTLDSKIDKYTCELIDKAQKIKIEYDKLALEKDKYNRQPVWLYVDNVLIQELLIKKGYGQVDKVYGNYSYLNTLCDYQKEAISQRIGIWNYPNIKEAYCNSGYTLDNKVESTIKNKKKKNNNINLLFNLIIINIFIVLLLLVYRKRFL